MIRLLLSWVLLLLLGSCGGGSTGPPVVKNPYAEQMKVFSRNGADAMRRERWASAQSSFERALDAARLAHDAYLQASAWYNLGMLHVAAAQPAKAEEALQSALQVATNDGLPVIRIRSQLALALIYARAGKAYPEVREVDEHLPVDVHMSAARLAQLKGQDDLAHVAYLRVLAKGGKGRKSIKMQAEAYMGLALLAYTKGDFGMSLQYDTQVLQICKKIGAPRLAAHALLLRADLDVGIIERKKSLNQAWDMYRVLHDGKGQVDSIQKLILLAKEENNAAQLQRLRQALLLLQAPEDKPAVEAIRQ